MINIIVPIIEKYKDKYNKLLSKLVEQEDVNICVGIEEKNLNEISQFQEEINISVTTFENNSSQEGMINRLHSYVKGGAIMVLRKPISYEEFIRFANCQQEIATCKIHRSKIKNFIFSIWQAMLKIFLGIKEYEGDSSVIVINEDISTVVGESGNLSFASRANRWRGIEQTTIEVKSDPVKKELDKKSILKYSLLAIFSLLLGVILTTVLCLTVKISVIIGLLLVCLDLICVAITFLTIIITVFNARVGKKHIEEAREVNSI